RHVTASDLSPRCVDVLHERFAARADIDIVKGDARAAAEDRHVHTAGLVNVLEHIPDDVQALRDLYDALEPGGTVLVFAPALPALYGAFDRRIGHCRRYRRSTLATGVSTTHFERA